MAVSCHYPLQAEHRKGASGQSERTGAGSNEYVDKMRWYSLHEHKLPPLTGFSLNALDFSEMVIQKLRKLKKVRLKGYSCSLEFDWKFSDKSAAFQFIG